MQFFKLAIPGLIMLCLEWWNAEVATFIAGYISEDELAANSAWFQTASIVYMVRSYYDLMPFYVSAGPFAKLHFLVDLNQL